MSTDRELLELAAKAAGLAGFWVDVGLNTGANETPVLWNPLTDDGDALRLAVKLHFAMDIGVMLTSIDGIQDSDKGIASELHGDDPYSATRRAIVRAAAEIGRAA